MTDIREVSTAPLDFSLAASVLRRGASRVADIVDTIRMYIANGSLSDGDRLPSEKELARQFRVSQPTVREALSALEAVGLVQVMHGRGVFVRADPTRILSNSIQTIMEIEQVGIVEVQEVRTALAMFSIAQTAKNHTEVELRRIETAAEQLADVTVETPATEIAARVIEFHVALSAGTRNPLMFALESFVIELLVQFQLDALPGRGIEQWVKGVESRANDRSAVLKAVKSRDAKAAVDAILLYFTAQRHYFAEEPHLNAVRLGDTSRLPRLNFDGWR